jgi:hypothetical protein
MRLVSRQLRRTPSHDKELVYHDTFYTRATGEEKLSYTAIETRSDLMDALTVQRSADNGQTWTDEPAMDVYVKQNAGSIRRHLQPGWVDPANGRLVTVLNEGHFPSDDAIKDGMTCTYLCCWVSSDGGRTYPVKTPIIQNGCSPEKPIQGVTVGKNAVMLGDKGSMILKTKSGKLLVPVQVCPVGPDGNYINPGGGYTFHYTQCLIGTWNDPSPNATDMNLTWEVSAHVEIDPARSTRGAIEPTLAQFPDGRILMVMRASNGGKKDPDCQIPSHKWFSISQDDGKTWTKPEPWGYDTGELFYSPSSMSQLVAHPNGQTYWIGNIAEKNCRGNSPRHPLWIGRVDPASLKLIKNSLCKIDDRAQGEPETMTLSNFSAHVDRKTGEIVIHMSRWLLPNWAGKAYEYRVSVD